MQLAWTTIWQSTDFLKTFSKGSGEPDDFFVSCTKKRCWSQSSCSWENPLNTLSCLPSKMWGQWGGEESDACWIPTRIPGPICLHQSIQACTRDIADTNPSRPMTAEESHPRGREEIFLSPKELSTYQKLGGGAVNASEVVYASKKTHRQLDGLLESKKKIFLLASYYCLITSTHTHHTMQPMLG